MIKGVVLLSGGVDSATCLGMAIDELGVDNVSAVSVFYGQKHSKELECARNIAKYYGIKHYELDLSSIFEYSNCPLLSQSTEEIEHKSYIDQIKENGEGMVKTYVPFRNGLMLSSVASLALSIYEDAEQVNIYLGAHADDSAGNAYADCSPEFAQAMYSAIYTGTYNKVVVQTPLINLNKAGVVREGLELGVPYELTWSCYEGHEKACGTCATCIDRQNAFIANGELDPIGYEERIDSEGVQFFSEA